MNESFAHHYPPELMTLLIDCIPRLIKGKRDVLTFFKGCGVPKRLLNDLEMTVAANRDSIKKFDIVRQVLVRLNDEGDSAIAPRREILKRITQWDDFSTCYDNDRMEAKGYVAEVQRLVNVKDSFTRMSQERENAQQEARTKREADLAATAKVKGERDGIKKDLYALFGITDASKRGTALEGILNRLFKSHGILVRESFRVVGRQGEGVVEQIDGVIEFDGHLYLVEMKWWSQPLGVGDVSPHLVRVFGRSGARGLVISSSGFTEPAVSTCRDALQQRVCVLATLEEFVLLLEQEQSLVSLLRHKVRAAITDKAPLVEPLKGGGHVG